MIEFIMKQESYDERDVTVRVATRAEQLGAVVDAFREFLIHAGFSYSSVERILYVEGEHQGFAREAGEGFRQRGDGNPEQGDFFDDGFDATDEESGV